MMADTLVPLAPGVWLVPLDPEFATVKPVVGVITAASGTILVDAGNSPGHAREIMGALGAIGAPPLRAVIYTHHHWDHTFGAAALGVPAIGHERCREAMLQMATAPWGPAYLREEVDRNPLLATSYGAIEHALGGDWGNFRILPPAVTFPDRLRLHLDDLTVELEHVGGEHAGDSIVVRVHEAGVIFLGDCFYPPPLHRRAPGATSDWAMLEGLMDDRFDLYVQGHGPPARRSALRAVLANVRAR